MLVANGISKWTEGPPSGGGMLLQGKHQFLPIDWIGQIGWLGGMGVNFPGMGGTGDQLCGSCHGSPDLSNTSDLWNLPEVQSMCGISCIMMVR